MLDLYSISDEYIRYLRKEVPNVYDSHENHRLHSRKYVGILVLVRDIKYFIPLSSPKPSDYLSDGTIRNSTLTILRLTRTNSGVARLLSTMRISHMIPVPDSEIERYNVQGEKDIAYKDLIEDELRWIEHNDTEIQKRAKRVYFLKKNESKTRNERNYKTLDSILPFTKLEYLCEEWRNAAK